jgi:Complex I intermediate-associated protein 30 (CIA30)
MDDEPEWVIAGAAGDNGVSALGTPWQAVSDRVMGGVSRARVSEDVIDGRRCRRLSGDVRLENNGGFIQMALDLGADGGGVDAGACDGVRLSVHGYGETYGCHLRTLDCTRPWQSYRATFNAAGTWRTVDLPFRAFVPYRLDEPLDIQHLRRLGLVAIGRAFYADLAVERVSFYRQSI